MSLRSDVNVLAACAAHAWRNTLLEEVSEGAVREVYPRTQVRLSDGHVLVRTGC